MSFSFRYRTFQKNFSFLIIILLDIKIIAFDAKKVNDFA